MLHVRNPGCHRQRSSTSRGYRHVAYHKSPPSASKTRYASRQWVTLFRIQTHPASRIEELMPWRWRPLNESSPTKMSNSPHPHYRWWRMLNVRAPPHNRGHLRDRSRRQQRNPRRAQCESGGQHARATRFAPGTTRRQAQPHIFG